MIASQSCRYIRRCSDIPSRVVLQLQLQLQQPTRGISSESFYFPNPSTHSTAYRNQMTVISTQTRQFRTQRHRSNRNQPPPGPLANEALVSAIMKKSRGSPATAVQVRLVLEQGIDSKASAEIVSLSEAIQASIDSEKDLVAVSLQQQTPVVKVVSLKALEYKESKITAARKNSGALPDKEVRFRAGIAQQDMQRKIDKVSSFLAKGHKCTIQIRARRRELLADPDSTRKTVEQILNLTQDCGEPIKKPNIHPEGFSAQIYLQPIVRKKVN